MSDPLQECGSESGEDICRSSAGLHFSVCTES